MSDFFFKFFDTSDFPDRWHCGQWSGFHGWLHIISDLAVFAAYLTIPFVILYFLRRRDDIPFPKVFYLFAAFVFACGMVHLVEATIFWWPIYRISGTFKLLTAIVSWVTVIGLVRILPAAITMRSAAELTAEVSKRREAEMRFRAMLESAPDAIVIVNAKGVIELINRQTEILFGYTKNELLGTPVEFLIPLRSRPESPWIEESLQSVPHVEGCESYGLRKDGTEFPIEIRLSPIASVGERLISSAIRDVSERVEAQMALAREKAKFEAIVNAIPDAVIFADTDRNITFANPATEQLFGYQPNELLGQPTVALYESHDEYRRQGIERYHLNGNASTSRFESNWKRKNGTLFPGEAVGAVICELDGTPLGFLGVIEDITARQEAEKSLRIQERALESAVNGIVICDPNQEHNPIIYVNKAIQVMTGFTADELLGRECTVLHQSAPDQEGLHQLESAFLEQRKCIVELHNLRKDGTPYWNELIMSPIHDNDGSVTHFIGIQSDITQRRETAEALRKSEQLFSAFMDNSPFVTWAKNANGRYEFCNQNYREQNGLPTKDWIGKTDFELLSKETAESYREMDLRVLQNGKPIDFEMQELLPNGDTRDWYVIKFPFHIEEDKILIGGIAVDMAEQRRAESERDRFFETSMDLMCIANFQGYFKRVNQAFTNILGYSREELLTGPFPQLVHDNDRQSTQKALDELATGKQLSQFENRYRCKDGTYRLISWTTAPPDLDNKVVFAVGRDITEKRSLERKLLQAADNEQRRIAHDLHDGLGQELAGVAMMADTLARSLEGTRISESKLARKIALHLKSSLQLTRTLVRGLRPVEIDTHGLASALSQLADQTTEMYGIKCSFEGGGDGDLTLHDSESATHLFRIAQEAVTNAAKHGQPGTIQIHFRESNGVVELNVIDDGIGISDLNKSDQGIGMKSMHYRSNLIGCKLLVEPNETGGTSVSCRLDAF